MQLSWTPARGLSQTVITVSPGAGSSHPHGQLGPDALLMSLSWLLMGLRSQWLLDGGLRCQALKEHHLKYQCTQVSNTVAKVAWCPLFLIK